MARRTRPIVPALAGLAVVVLGLGSAAADEPVDTVLDLLSYRVHTVYGPDRVETTQDAVLLVPLPVDVDHDLATGLGGQDVLVQLQVDAGRATLRVTQLPGAPSPLPLAVEAILADPRHESDLRVAFGYDALADTAPAAYDATIALLGEGERVSSFTLDLHAVAPGSTLGVTADVYREGPGGERLDPQRGRIDFTPVPAVAHFGVIAGSQFGLNQSGVDLAADTPTKAVVLIEDVQGADESRVDATIDQVPASLSILLTTSDDGSQTFSYSATARVQLIDVRGTQLVGGAIVEELVLRLQDMAMNASLVQDSPTHSTFQADSPIGTVEVGAATGGAVKFLSEPNAYLYADDSGGVDSFAVRVLGLSAFEISTADPFLVDATLQAGPFHVVLVQGAASLEAWIRDLPDHVRIQFSAVQGSLSYQGSAVIGEITVDATDPAGIAGRATQLHLLARDIPRALDLAFGESGSTVTIDAKGQTLGLIEVQLTSGPDDRLDPAVDGVLLEDLADRYVVFARVTGLRKIVGTQMPQPDVTLETTGGRVFKVDLNELVGSRVVYTRATLDSLPASVHVRLADPEIFYDASGTASSLVFDTNSGDRWNLHADIGNPLPAHLSVCSSGDGFCTGFQRSAGAGSLKFDASEHTSVNVLDCVRPLDASCPSAPSTYTRLDNWRVKHFEFDADADSTGFSGYTFNNTNGELLQGYLKQIDGSSGFEADIRPGYWSQNRKVEWSFWGLSKNKSGSVNCAGSSFSIRVFGIWIGVTSYVC
jgi:hypothetical protein